MKKKSARQKSPVLHTPSTTEKMPRTTLRTGVKPNVRSSDSGTLITASSVDTGSAVTSSVSRESVPVNQNSRTPIVAVLGHVDHGKTTLLDKIRHSDIASKEFGGITQHIGAYQIETTLPHQNKSRKITFIDTPGHEAFAKIRARGANVADIVILVVAANDGVMPQTVESIDHIQAAKIPSIVAINKIDLPGINTDKIKKQLTKHGLKLEEYGGETPVIPISAKTGQGIDKLIEMIFLLAEMNNVREENPEIFKGIVIDSSLSKNTGAVATVITQSGKLETGQVLKYEDQDFKIRAIIDQNGVNIKTTVWAGTPVQILGWKTLPQVGSVVSLKEQYSELTAQPRIKEISGYENKTPTVSSLVPETTPAGSIEEEKIRIILKADTAGSLEAILQGLTPDIEVISSHIGIVNESDIFLAKTTKAIVIGFHQKISENVLKLAQSEKVILKTYNIIYELFDEIKDVIAALKKGGLVTELGSAKIIALFPYNDGTVAGIRVTSGRIAKGDQVRIMNNEVEVGKAKIKSIRHFKEEVTKVEQGKEAGVLLSHNLPLLTGYSIISIG